MRRMPICFGRCARGGGSFGVVTALEFDLLRLPEIFAGALFSPGAGGRRAARLAEWTTGMPEEMTSVWRVLNFPPIPEVPEPSAANHSPSSR